MHFLHGLQTTARGVNENSVFSASFPACSNARRPRKRFGVFRATGFAIDRTDRTGSLPIGGPTIAEKANTGELDLLALRSATISLFDCRAHRPSDADVLARRFVRQLFRYSIAERVSDFMIGLVLGTQCGMPSSVEV